MKFDVGFKIHQAIYRLSALTFLSLEALFFLISKRKSCILILNY